MTYVRPLARQRRIAVSNDTLGRHYGASVWISIHSKDCVMRGILNVIIAGSVYKEVIPHLTSALSIHSKTFVYMYFQHSTRQALCQNAMPNAFV